MSKMVVCIVLRAICILWWCGFTTTFISDNPICTQRYPGISLFIINDFCLRISWAKMARLCSMRHGRATVTGAIYNQQHGRPDASA